MDSDELKRFMESQRKEIVKYKKKKEAEAGKDLGDEPALQWCEEESSEFRKRWYKNNGGDR